MQFNSYDFILAFLPSMILAYYLFGRINEWIGKVILIIGSVIFYGFADVTMLKILGLSLAVNFVMAHFIERLEWRKFFVIIPICINIGILGYFKYTNFVLENINLWFGQEFALKALILPIGISFYTFQQIAYIVAVYRKEIPSVKFLDYAAYILYFPKLLMGPLADPVDFIEQLNDVRLKRINWNNIACGIKIFSFGLLKKVLLADTFAQAVSWGGKIWDKQQQWIGFL